METVVEADLRVLSSKLAGSSNAATVTTPSIAPTSVATPALPPHRPRPHPPLRP